MNYGELKSQFLGLMNRRDLSSNTALETTFLQQALTRLQRTLRVPAMEASASVTWDSTVQLNGQLAVPSDMLELIDIHYTSSSDNYTLRKSDLTTVSRKQLDTDHPSVFCRRGSNFLLAPIPTNGDAVRIDYYAELPALSLDADTNWVSDIAPDLILYAACVLACTYYKDKRVSGFEQLYEQAFSELDEMAQRDALTGSAQIASAYRFDDSLDGNG